ncbi:G1/S-specific cyclin-D3-like isoform X2 [Symsagittifera roscoffensis]|uniref:G1/S-specific cyclin-D3-like isoform X2 n=1 Tax=Symsagittifera roscoffensis TaxID=84072 RepID=UPI00307C836E
MNTSSTMHANQTQKTSHTSQTNTRSQSAAKKNPKFAFAIDTRDKGKIPTNTDPNTIHKLFWTKFKPANSSSASSNSVVSGSELRSLHNLLQLEKQLLLKGLQCVRQYTTGPILSTNYSSPDIELWMRQKCLEWLLEVSEGREADPNVTLHAMSLFDQMLVRQCIPNEKLQLVAATGYLLASKLRETCPVTPAELEALTYSSCSEQEIRQFEMVMTVSLDWDLDSVTPLPFLQSMASFLVCSEVVGVMVERATEVVLKCVLCEQMLGLSQSLLAAASLLYTMASLAVSPQAQNVFNLCSHRLVDILGCNMETLLSVTDQMHCIMVYGDANPPTTTNCTSQMGETGGMTSAENNNDLDYPPIVPPLTSVVSNVTPPKSAGIVSESVGTTPSAPHDMNFAL